ncbi:MAG: hypothetical protein ACLFU8_02010 [Anaerolineales bacterium]
MHTKPNTGSATRAITAAETLWLAAAFLIPWVFNPRGASAFELPKVALLRALVLLLGVAILMTGVRDRDLRQGLPLFLPAVILSLVYFLTSLTSVNPHASIWGSHERQQGLLTLFAYPLLFTLLNLGLRRGKELPAWIALTVALTGHLLDLQFSFETTATATLFWLLLALVAALERGFFTPRVLERGHFLEGRPGA